MMLDLTLPVQTRSGLKARIIASDVKGTQPIVAVVTDRNGHESVEIYTATGQYFPDARDGVSTLDLVNVPRDVLKKQLVGSLGLAEAS